MAQLGRYVLEAELGRGAMGVVYRARDPRIDRVVALKTLRPDAVADPNVATEVKQRFLNEAKAAGRLSHANIVTVFDADEDEATGVAYMAMEYVEGVELKDLLAEGLDRERLLDIVDGVAAALDHAHSRGVVHRDVKPANILLDSEGCPRLTDFGIARLGASTMTQDGQFLGSPAYMSPEQVRSQEITGKSDIFGLGVVVFEALTGKRPFVGADLVSTTHAIANEQPRRPSELASGLPAAVDQVLQRALAKSPADRPATATELAKQLRAALAGESLAAQTLVGPRGDAPPTASPLKSRGVQVWLVAVVSIAVIAGLALAFGGGEDEAPQQAAATPPVTTSRMPTEEPASPPPPKPEPLPERAAEPRPAIEEDAPSEPEEEPVVGTAAPAETVATSESVEAPPVPPATAATGTLRIDLFTFHSGTLVVFDGDTEIARRSVSELERKRRIKLRNPKRHFVVEVPVATGRRMLSFVFQVRDGKRLQKRSVKDIAEGGTLRVELDIGTLGRDIDIRYR